MSVYVWQWDMRAGITGRKPRNVFVNKWQSRRTPAMHNWCNSLSPANRNQPGVTLMGAAALRSKGFMQLVQFTLRVCGQAIQYIMTWVKRVQFRVVRGRYTCILCALMMYFTYWVYDQFGYQWLGLVVEEPTSSTGEHTQVAPLSV